VRFIARLARRSLNSGDRGVTIIEYALIIGAVVVGSLSSMGALDTSIGSNYKTTADDIGQPDLAVFDVTTTTSAGGMATTTTTSTTTTTTAAPTTTSTTTTTAAPTTTTTAAPTTTTTAAPTTTTTAAPPTTTAAPSGGESLTVTAKDKSYKWKGYYHAKIKFKLKDSSGDPLANANIKVRFTLADGAIGTATGSTNSWGRVAFAWRWLSEDDFNVTVKILSVTKSGTTYDPGGSTYTLYEP